MGLLAEDADRFLGFGVDIDLFLFFGFISYSPSKASYLTHFPDLFF